MPTRWQMVGPAQAPWDGLLENTVCPDGVCRFMVESVCKPLVFEVRGRAADDLWPTVVYATCLHIAVKLLHKPPNSRKCLGGYTCGNLLMYLCNMRLEADDVGRVESWVLRRLDHAVVPVQTARAVRAPSHGGSSSFASEVVSVRTPDGTPNNVKMAT